MKYKLRFNTYRDSVAIHLSARLTQGAHLCFEGPEEIPSRWEDDSYDGEKSYALLVKHLFEIDGIEIIEIEQHSITIYKGVAFEWNSMKERILALINLDLFPKEELEPLVALHKKPKDAQKNTRSKDKTI